MPWDVGDHLARTSHLVAEPQGVLFLLCCHYWINGVVPNDDALLATIARVPLKRWRKIKPLIEPFFGPDWSSNDRLDAELQKARAISQQRRVAGQKGGFKSQITKSMAVSQGLRLANARAFARPTAGAIAQANARPIGEATASANTERPDTHLQSHTKPSYSETAAPRAEEERVGEQRNKPPSDMTRPELEEAFERRRNAKGGAS
jgi:uncharacterized protein YdaU (DUF1376 family)